MSGKLSYERYLWFHSRMKAGKFPKLTDLAEKFEISMRQASREIEFMRYFFEAPIEYSREEYGYFYSDSKFELPGVWASEEEIITLIIAKRLASTIPHKKKKKRFDAFIRKFLGDSGIDISELEKRVSIKNIRFYRVEPKIFEHIVTAVSHSLKLKIRYRSPYNDEEKCRMINPLHLLLYMGNWHLLAYCDEKKEIRDFVLSRIYGSEVMETPVPDHLLKKNLKKMIYENYGIFLEGEKKYVSLRFSTEVSKIARDQEWFPGQKTTELNDGRLELTFPVSDFREILRDILSIGPGVEILSPPELRTMVSESIKKMSEIYRD